jgi:hypothetical protein
MNSYEFETWHANISSFIPQKVKEKEKEKGVPMNIAKC